MTLTLVLGGVIKMKYKSQGEENIAEALEKNNIEFIYENPLFIMETREGEEGIKPRIWYPDFWLPEYGIVIEFFGGKSKNYKKGVRHKKMNYKKLKIDLIPVHSWTTKENLEPYLLKEIQKIIDSKRKIFDNRDKK